jgi:queuine tRNA-ribosyltransferase
MLSFEVTGRDPSSTARCGKLRTPHGEVDTPAFMPVGTRGAVKGIAPAQLRETGSQIVLANTYHLYLRPGPEVVAELGGLHRFMGWDGPLLTDSGGFQVFSLAELVEVDDDGVSFRSHIDGAPMRLDPATAVRVQNRLGADIIMALDLCPALPCPAEELKRACERTVRWARACREAHSRADQWLFGIIQGGTDPTLRRACADQVMALDFPGYAIGGLSVGESFDERLRVVSDVTPLLPADRPRYLMGVGTPRDLLAAVACGIDLFDCVLPTRNGRNAWAFTPAGAIRLRNKVHRTEDTPIEPGCDCPACRSFSRGYLRHLFLADEMLGPILVSIHNLRFIQRFMRRLRELIPSGRLGEISGEYPLVIGPRDEQEAQ